MSHSAGESSAKAGSAHMRPWETQLQQNKAAFSVGCPTREARGGSAYMKQNAIISVGYNRNHEKFGQQPYAWEKKLEKGISQLDKGTRSGVHDTSKEFGLMIREKLQEFTMILTKEYHYKFLMEYFDDYQGSFNKEEFLKMEQLKEKSRLWKSNSLLTSNVEWKKDTDCSRTIKEECNISDEIGGEWHYSKGVHDEQIDRTADTTVPSNIFEKEVHVEEKSSIHKEEEDAGLPTWKQEILTERVVKVVLQPREELIHLDVPKEIVDEEIGVDHTFQEQETDDPKADELGPAVRKKLEVEKRHSFDGIFVPTQAEPSLTWVKIGNKKVKTALAGGKRAEICCLKSCLICCPSNRKWPRHPFSTVTI